MAEIDICFGDIVILPDGSIGTVRFIGNTSLNDTLFYGVHLRQSVGENDGCIMKRRYFKCPDGCGTFVNRKDIKLHKKHQISASFSYNQSVQIFNSTLRGKIKFIGMTSFGAGYWYGIALDDRLTSSNKQKNKFTHYLKKRDKNIYFVGDAKQSMFVRQNQLRYVKEHNIETKVETMIETRLRRGGHTRHCSEPLTPSTPLSPSTQTAKAFDDQFPNIKAHKTMQFKKRVIPKYESSESVLTNASTRKFRVRDTSSTHINLSESNSDLLSFGGCDVKQKKKKKKKKKARARSDSVKSAKKKKKKSKMKNVRSKSDALNKRRDDFMKKKKKKRTKKANAK